MSADERPLRRMSAADDPRLARLRRLAWLLDRSIPIGNYRIGLDPLIGLIPGLGDVVGAGLSVVIIYDAARLGLPVHVLVRMIGNVFAEMLVGAIPVLGDLFDFVWHANVRNLQLVEKHFDPLRAERPARRIAWAVALVACLLIAGMFTLLFFVLSALWQAINSMG